MERSAASGADNNRVARFTRSSQSRPITVSLRASRDSAAKLTADYLTSVQSGDLAITAAIERSEVKVAGQCGECARLIISMIPPPIGGRDA